MQEAFYLEASGTEEEDTHSYDEPVEAQIEMEETTPKISLHAI